MESEEPLRIEIEENSWVFEQEKACFGETGGVSRPRQPK
jgi:hypothetical protein